MLTIKAVQQVADLPSSVDNLTSSLQDCRKSNGKHAMKLYIDLCNGGLDVYAQIANYLIPPLAVYKSLSIAEKVFNKLLHRNESCWTSLMHAYVNHGQPQYAFPLLKKMEDDCVQTSKHTLSVLLNASAKSRCTQEGQELHAMVVEEGLECDTFVGISLMNMYAKCGLLAYARDVFDGLSTRDVVSWTTLIAGYSEYGDDSQALSCLEDMQKEALVPDAVAFACGLKACGAIKCKEKGCHLHMEVMQEGVEGDSYVCRSLVYMYAECGLLLEAQEVFNDSPTRDVFMWNVLHSSFAKQSRADDGLGWLNQMRLEGVCPDANSYACSLQTCRNTKAEKVGQILHSEAVKEGLETDFPVSNSLVDMYLGCGLSEEAEKVFDNIEDHDVVSWNTLMGGYLQNMQNDKVLNSFDQILLGGVLPDVTTFMYGLKACGFCGCAGTAQLIHIFITKVGMERDPSICSSLVTTYGDSGLLVAAQEIFDRSPERQETLWIALFDIFVKHGLSDEVLRCLEQMSLEGVSMTASLLVYGLKASGSLRAMKKGTELHDQATREGFDTEVFVGNTLIDMYGKLGAVAEAQQVFQDLIARDVVTWTALITVYTEHGWDEEALNSLEMMQDYGISPNFVTYIFGMKASSRIGAIEKGQEIHSQVIKKGFEKGSYICSSLLDMYLEFGLLADASVVFNERPAEAVTSWNTLIRGYADHGSVEDALSCLEQMKLEGVVMDSLTFVCGLKACMSLEDMQRGRELHADIIRYGFDGNLAVGNKLLDLYAKHGSDEEMNKIFCILPARDVVSWSTLMAGYNLHGLSKKVLTCLKQMQSEGISPNVASFVSSIQACEEQEFLEWGQQLHAEIVNDGYEGDSFVNSCLICMYCGYGLLPEALDIFDEQLVHDVISWNTLMSGYAEQEMDDEVLKCLQTMQVESVNPSVATFACGLKACGSIGSIELGRALHIQLAVKGLESLATIQNALVDMYLKCGLFQEARKTFDELSAQDIVLWTTLIAGYVENGLGEEALSCAEQMIKQGISYDAVTFVCCLRACRIMEALDKGRHYHAEIVRKGFEKDGVICNVLVDMYAKCGLLAEVEEMVDKLPVHDMITWSALVVSYGKHSFDEEVLVCFENMRAGGISPDTFIFVSFLKACGAMKALERGHTMHADACKWGFLGNSLIGNALIAMYGKCNALEDAEDVFNKLKFQDTNAWNTLIIAYTEHGHNEAALECMRKMQVQGCIPNFNSYHSILKVCGNVGALVTGQELLMQAVKEGLGNGLICRSRMDVVRQDKDKDVHGADVNDVMLANACIDMLGKCGNLIDAKEVFDAMASRDQVTWNSLLWGYARQGQLDHALSLVDLMKREGLYPDKVTSLGYLNLCSHLGLVEKSQEYLDSFANQWSGCWSLEHFNCLLDLFGRAGRLDEAFEMVERVLFLPDYATWATLLGACRSSRNELLRRQVLEYAAKSFEIDAGTLVLISNIYAEAGVVEKE